VSTRNKVFFYWEGELPGFIKLCIETIHRNCNGFEIHHLNKDNIENYLELPEEYYKIKKINHKTDYLKANLIYKYGGFWIDADTIILKDFSEWNKFLEEYDFIGTPGFFGGTKGSKTIKKWIDGMDISKEELEWADLINPLIKSDKYAPFTPLKKEYICPLWYDDTLSEFFKNISLRRYITENTRVCILFNACFPEEFKKKTDKEILEDETFIGRLFRLALGYKKKVELPDYIGMATNANIADTVNQILKYLRNQ